MNNPSFTRLEDVKIIPNACTITSIRDLIGDPLWLPREVAEMIVRHNSMPDKYKAIVEKYAPVKTGLSASYNEETHVLRLYDGPIGGEPYAILTGDDLVIVAYATTPGRSHDECVRVSALEWYFLHKEIYSFTCKIPQIG